MVVIEESYVGEPEAEGSWNFAECDQERTRAVRFSPDVQEISIEWHQNLPSELRDALWYNAIAHRHIQENIRRTLCLMNNDTAIPEEYADIFCPRGLEGRTRKALKRRIQDRNAVRDAVLGFHNAPGKDPAAVAQAASMAAVWAQEEAHKSAALDEYEAREYLKDFVADDLDSYQCYS